MFSQPLVVDIPDLDIPDAYSTMIPLPNAHMPVDRFRFHVLQPQLGSLVFPSASASLSTAPPSGTYNLSNLSKDPIPPASHLRSLKERLISSTPDGPIPFHSVRNPANNTELLPLWVITVWEEVSLLAHSQDKWRASYSWVESLRNARHLDDHQLTATFVHLGKVGWNSPMSLFGLAGITNISLAQFLGDGRVNDEAVDLMCRFIATKPNSPTILSLLICDYRASSHHTITLSAHPLLTYVNFRLKSHVQLCCTFRCSMQSTDIGLYSR